MTRQQHQKKPKRTAPENTQTDLERELRQLDTLSTAADVIGRELGAVVAGWTATYLHVQRLAHVSDFRRVDDCVGEGMHAACAGATRIFEMHSTFGNRPRSFVDFSQRLRVRCQKAAAEATALEQKAG